jgi:hypothetical protein
MWVRLVTSRQAVGSRGRCSDAYTVTREQVFHPVRGVGGVQPGHDVPVGHTEGRRPPMHGRYEISEGVAECPLEMPASGLGEQRRHCPGIPAASQFRPSDRPGEPRLAIERCACLKGSA